MNDKGKESYWLNALRFELFWRRKEVGHIPSRNELIARAATMGDEELQSVRNIGTKGVTWFRQQQEQAA